MDGGGRATHGAVAEGEGDNTLISFTLILSFSLEGRRDN
jgi:hypothetical protein